MGLERTHALLAELGHPEAGLGGALVTGTNGKGSTCAFLASILAAAGLRTGTMPSPHLASYTERVQINGAPISEGDFAAALDAVTPALEEVGARLGEPTEFEILTALALSWLSPRVDRLVIEPESISRLRESLETAAKMASGLVLIWPQAKYRRRSCRRWPGRRRKA